MSRRWWFKAGLLIVGSLLCILYVLPSFLPEGSLGPIEQWVTSRVKLGLDLQGGMHLVYSVKVDKAVIDKVERYGEDMEDELKKKKIPYEKVSRIEGRFAVAVQANSPEDLKKFEEEVFKKEDYDRHFRIGERSDSKSMELVDRKSVV